MRLEKTFYMDSMRNYMILKGPDGQERTGYQYRMLSANSIDRMMDCSIRFIDNTCLFYYDVTSMQSLSILYRERYIGLGDLREILEDVLGAQEKLADYLLDARRIIYDPSCIFYDFEKRQYLFAYYPEDLDGNSCAVLYSFLADRIDTADDPAVRAAFELAEISSAQEGFLLSEKFLTGILYGSRPEMKSCRDAYSYEGTDYAAEYETGYEYEADYGAEYGADHRVKNTGYEDSDWLDFIDINQEPAQKDVWGSGPSVEMEVPRRYTDEMPAIVIAAVLAFLAGLILFVVNMAIEPDGVAGPAFKYSAAAVLGISVVMFLYIVIRSFGDASAARPAAQG